MIPSNGFFFPPFNRQERHEIFRNELIATVSHSPFFFFFLVTCEIDCSKLSENNYKVIIL